MTNEEILAEVVNIFEPYYKKDIVNKEDIVKIAQKFIRTHAQIFKLSPEDPLDPIAEHLLFAAEKMVEPSFSNTPIANYELYGKIALF